MMYRLRQTAILFGLIAILTMPFLSSARSPDSTEGNRFVAQNTLYQGDVFLLRGFGNVFSRGLDQIGQRLDRRGIKTTVAHHTTWRSAAAQIITNQKRYGHSPVVLIGHSLGANAVVFIAQRLQKHNIKVQYLVTLEPTKSLVVPSNVDAAVNYYLSDSAMGLPLKKQRNSRGSFRNVDLVDVRGIGHFSIEKDAEVQRKIIENVLLYLTPSPGKKALLQ